MDWEVWAFTSRGNQQYIRTFASQDLARWWAINWIRQGYFPLPSSGTNPEIFIRMGRDFPVLYTKAEGAAHPRLET